MPGAYVKLYDSEKRLTFMVISQAQGRYIARNLPPGKYVVQGIGDGMQSAATPVIVAAGKPAKADLSLSVPQPATLANGWPGRPGKVGGVEMWMHEPQTPLVDGEGKEVLEEKCKQCHETERIVLLRFDRTKWGSTVDRMREYIADLGMDPVSDQEETTIVGYLTRNYSGAPGMANARPDSNSRLPRTLGRVRRADYVAVDYELPRDPERDPHDVTVDPRGNAWVAERNGCCIAKFDPKTFTFTEIELPAGKVKSRLSSPIGQDGDKIWVQDVSHNRRWVSYDTKTGKFGLYPVPESIKGAVGSNTVIADKREGSGGLAIPWSSGWIRPPVSSFPIPFPTGQKRRRVREGYGMAVSGDGRVWFAERDPSRIGRLDPETGKIDEYEPPLPNSIPRRMGSDTQGNIWVGLHESGKLMKIDYETAKMTIIDPPTENSAPMTPWAIRTGACGSASRRLTRSPASIPRPERSWNFPCPTPNPICAGSSSIPAIRIACGGAATHRITLATSKCSAARMPSNKRRFGADILCPGLGRTDKTFPQLAGSFFCLRQNATRTTL